MKRISIIIVSILLTYFPYGCSDFLSEKSSDEVIPRTTTDLNELLWGSAYKSSAYMSSYSCLLDDDAVQNVNSTRNGSYMEIPNKVACYTWQGDFYNRCSGNSLTLGGNTYVNGYIGIKGCNAVLDYIDDASGTTEEKEVITAQALALRGFYYLLLVNTYGTPYNYDKTAPGVPLKLHSGTVENGVARSSVERCYEQIITDFTDAISLFEKHPNIVMPKHRISLAAVYHLLARTYLYMENWGLAADCASEVIARHPKVKDLTSINPTYYIVDANNEECFWTFGQVQDFTNVFVTNQLLFIPSESLISGYSASDKRRSLFFLTNLYPSKCNEYTLGHGKALRVPEAYLIRAEANAMLAVEGDASKLSPALNDLNQIRKNRIVGYSDVNITDANQLVMAVRQERRLELCLEDLRWFDLRRYGMPSITHDVKMVRDGDIYTYTLAEKDPFYILPIPDSAFENNNLLTQNPSRTLPLREGVKK